MIGIKLINKIIVNKDLFLLHITIKVGIIKVR